MIVERDNLIGVSEFRSFFPKTREAVQKINNRETTELFNRFFGSVEFIDAVRWLVGGLKQSQGGDLTSNERASFAAYLFENFSYHLVKWRIRELMIGDCTDPSLSLRVLSPSQVFSFLDAAYPAHPTCESHLGLSMAKVGLKNPDGLIFEIDRRNIRLIALCEYTLQQGDLSKIGEKRSQITKMRSRRTFGDLLPGGARQAAMVEYLRQIDPVLPPRLDGDYEEVKLVIVKPLAYESEGLREQMVGNKIFVYPPFAKSQFIEIVDQLLKDARVNQELTSAFSAVHV